MDFSNLVIGTSLLAKTVIDPNDYKEVEVDGKKVVVPNNANETKEVTGETKVENSTTTTTSTSTPAAAPQAAPTQSLLFNGVLIVGMLVAMYFISFRGPQKERKKREEIRSSLKIGDNVLTSAGFYGKIVDIGTDVFIIEFGTNRGMRVPVRKESVEGVKEPILTPPAKDIATK